MFWIRKAGGEIFIAIVIILKFFIAIVIFASCKKHAICNYQNLKFIKLLMVVTMATNRGSTVRLSCS